MIQDPGPPIQSYAFPFPDYAAKGRGIPDLTLRWRGDWYEATWSVGSLLDPLAFLAALDHAGMRADLDTLWSTMLPSIRLQDRKPDPFTLAPGVPGGAYRFPEYEARVAFSLVRDRFVTALAAIAAPTEATP